MVSAAGLDGARGQACPMARAMPIQAIKRPGRRHALKADPPEFWSSTRAGRSLTEPPPVHCSLSPTMAAFKPTRPSHSHKSQPYIPDSHGMARPRNLFRTRAHSSKPRTLSTRWGSTRRSAATNGFVKVECCSAASTRRSNSRDSWKAQRLRVNGPLKNWSECWALIDQSLVAAFDRLPASHRPTHRADEENGTLIQSILTRRRNC
jgi:hypothetical protein